MAEIIKFPRRDGQVLTCEEYLRHVLEVDLASCVVVGTTKDDQVYIGSTTGDVGHVLFMMECGKRYLMELVEDDRRK